MCKSLNSSHLGKTSLKARRALRTFWRDLAHKRSHKVVGKLTGGIRMLPFARTAPKGGNMRRSMARGLLITACLTLILGVNSTQLQAQASHCSTARCSWKVGLHLYRHHLHCEWPIACRIRRPLCRGRVRQPDRQPDTECGRKFGSGRHYRDAQCEPRLHGHSDHQRVCEWTAAAYSRAGHRLRPQHEPWPWDFRVPGVAEWHKRSRGPYFG